MSEKSAQEVLDEIERKHGSVAAILAGLIIVAAGIAKWYVILHFVIKYW